MADKKIELKVNGNSIDMVPFVQKTVINTVEGLIKELRDCDNAEDIEIKISSK